MKKLYIYTLFIFVLAASFTSCQKSELYTPSGSETELNGDGDENTITDPDEDSKKGDG